MEPTPASEARVPPNTAWRGDSTHPQRLVLPAKVRALGPFLGLLRLLLGPPSVTESEPGQASLSEPLSWQEDGSGGRAKGGQSASRGQGQVSLRGCPSWVVELASISETTGSSSSTWTSAAP